MNAGIFLIRATQNSLSAIIIEAVCGCLGQRDAEGQADILSKDLLPIMACKVQ